MRKSYRKRGKHLRKKSTVQKKKKKEKKLPKKKRVLPSAQKNSKTPYSPKKSRAKATEEYSVLYPLTSSLSPSEKSKGARPNSAKATKR